MALSTRLKCLRITTILPILSLLCTLGGIGWLLLLPVEGYNRSTYISENALLPGQVNTYYGGSEQDVFRAYRHEVRALANATVAERVKVIGEIFGMLGLKVGTQKYRYEVAGEVLEGENVYSILQAPRGDATESMVLAAGWTNSKGELNEGGVALAMTLARYLKRWSVWSKDIIILIASDSLAGPHAWIDAYHDYHNPFTTSPLPLKSGAIQAAIVLDYSNPIRFESVHIIYDGINGQLPNLDLVNTAGHIARYQVGVPFFHQDLPYHNGNYHDKLLTMWRAMIKQGLGYGTGAHSAFIPYHINAITLMPSGEGWHDEGSLARLTESLLRSVNNLLESFHQSFFFYWLLDRRRFVSIGTYLPGGMAVAVGVSLLGIGLWLKATSSTPSPSPMPTEKLKSSPSVSPPSSISLLSPLLSLLTIHLLSTLPLTLFHHLSPTTSLPIFFIFTLTNLFLPSLILPRLLSFTTAPHQQLNILKSTSLLLLGMVLSALSTLNFALAAGVGVAGAIAGLISYITTTETYRKKVGIVGRAMVWSLHQMVSPMAVGLLGVYLAGLGGGDVEEGVKMVLKKAVVGWNIEGVWTGVVVWGVWWPSWVVAGVGI